MWLLRAASLAHFRELNKRAFVKRCKTLGGKNLNYSNGIAFIFQCLICCFNEWMDKYSVWKLNKMSHLNFSTFLKDLFFCLFSFLVICHPRPTAFSENTRVGICAKNSPLKKDHMTHTEIRGFHARLTLQDSSNNNISGPKKCENVR